MQPQSWWQTVLSPAAWLQLTLQNQRSCHQNPGKALVTLQWLQTRAIVYCTHDTRGYKAKLLHTPCKIAALDFGGKNAKFCHSLQATKDSAESAASCCELQCAQPMSAKANEANSGANTGCKNSGAIAVLRFWFTTAFVPRHVSVGDVPRRPHSANAA